MHQLTLPFSNAAYSCSSQYVLLRHGRLFKSLYTIRLQSSQMTTCNRSLHASSEKHVSSVYCYTCNVRARQGCSPAGRSGRCIVARMTHLSQYQSYRHLGSRFPNILSKTLTIRRATDRCTVHGPSEIARIKAIQYIKCLRTSKNTVHRI